MSRVIADTCLPWILVFMAVGVAAMDVRMATALAGAVPNVAAFCREQRVSRQTFYKWRRRFAEGGVDGLVERSRRPHRSTGTDPAVEDLVVAVRKRLAEVGADHGPDPIRWHLLGARDRVEAGGELLEGFAVPAWTAVPSRATIAAILSRRGQVVASPRKRPKSSLHRFVYARPNECWQSDWTKWALADGTPVAIAGTLDDHSRYLVGLAAGPGVGDFALVWQVFRDGVAEAGIPSRSLTDNGLVYSGRRRGTEVGFEVNLRALGVTAICSSPYHPQTCGKIERFWQTLKKWLRARDPAATLDELNAQLAAFRSYYNHHRPHRALHGATPAAAFTATAKGRPATRPLPAPTFVHHSRINSAGAVVVGPYCVSVGARWTGHHVHTIRDGDHIAIFAGTRLVRQLTAIPGTWYQRNGPNPDRSGYREPHPT